MFEIFFMFIVLVATVDCTIGKQTENVESRPDSTFKASFDKINEYLEKSLVDKDPEKNVAVARKWLTDELEKDTGNGKTGLIDAVKLFVSLEDVTKDDTCNDRKLEILMENDAATGGNAINENVEEGSKRRVDEIVAYYADKYSNSCIPVETGESQDYPYQGTYDQYGQYGYHNNYRRKGFKKRFKKFWKKLMKRLYYGRRYKYGYHQGYNQGYNPGYNQHYANHNNHHHGNVDVNLHPHGGGELHLHWGKQHW